MSFKIKPKQVTDEERVAIVRRCCYYFDYKWPRKMFSGVLFFEGIRITVDEFNEQARMFK